MPYLKRERQISKTRIKEKQKLYSHYTEVHSPFERTFDADYAAYVVKRNGQVKSMITSAKVQHDKVLANTKSSNHKTL